MNESNASYLDLITQVSHAMINLDNTSHLIDQILDILQKSNFHYATVKVSDPSTNEILIRFASGLSDKEMERGRYKIGEGITGTVYQTKEPILIRNIDEDERFLNRTKSKDTLTSSFFCYPIISNNNVLGVLSAMAPASDDTTWESHKKLFEVIIPLISQSVHIQEKIKVERQAIELENSKLRSELLGKKGVHNIIGKGSKMNAIFEQIRLVAPSNSTVLIQGQNGTGKELIADAIHYSSPRASKPFIKINCAALPENLLESELFGHEKGSFTGAIAQKKGKFEQAQGGSLFLDEIGEMSINLQAKLLRVLQAKEFERVGGMKTIQTNVRIIAATNIKIEEAIANNNFREDLYYRLNVFPIFLPRLAERQTDILLLAEYFLLKFSKENHKNITRLSTPAIDMLNSYHWPGNVRELENCIERAVLMCQTETIRSQDLPPSLQTKAQNIAPAYNGNWTLPQAVENLEKEMIVESLKQHHNHQGKASKDLGITERQMGYKIKKYGILF